MPRSVLFPSFLVDKTILNRFAQKMKFSVCSLIIVLLGVRCTGAIKGWNAAGESSTRVGRILKIKSSIDSLTARLQRWGNLRDGMERLPEAAFHNYFHARWRCTLLRAGVSFLLVLIKNNLK